MKKFNLSEIMKNAWAAFRATGKKFADCLHDAWNVAKMLTIGNLWENYGKRRIYFNQKAMMELLNIKVDRYKSSGRISCFSIDGEITSNTTGAQYMESLDRVYYDFADNNLHARIGRYGQEIMEKISEKLGLGL